MEEQDELPVKRQRLMAVASNVWNLLLTEQLLAPYLSTEETGKLGITCKKYSGFLRQVQEVCLDPTGPFSKYLNLDDALRSKRFPAVKIFKFYWVMNPQYIIEGVGPFVNLEVVEIKIYSRRSPHPMLWRELCGSVRLHKIRIFRTAGGYVDQWCYRRLLELKESIGDMPSLQHVIIFPEGEQERVYTRRMIEETV